MIVNCWLFKKAFAELFGVDLADGDPNKVVSTMNLEVTGNGIGYLTVKYIVGGTDTCVGLRELAKQYAIELKERPDEDGIKVTTYP